MHPNSNSPRTIVAVIVRSARNKPRRPFFVVIHNSKRPL